MSESGYVYILINPSMPNLVKIGKTQKKPEERAKELSSTTGIPTPFMVVYTVHFENCSKAEKHIHMLLESKGFRVSKNREFFNIPTKDAIDAIIETEKYFENLIESNSNKSYKGNIDIDVEPWENVLEIAESYHYGLGDYIQDYNDAIIYYQKAIQLGYKHGYLDIGTIYEFDLNNDKKAFDYYKKGINNGCIDCYAELGQYYKKHYELNKAQKSYELYMKYQSSQELIDLYICNHLVFSLKAIDVDKSKNKIEYLDKTLPYANMIIEKFENGSNLFNHYYTYYQSFYDLPLEARDGLVKYCNERKYEDYIYSKYEAEFKLGKDFLDYIKLIYKKGFVAPKEFKGEIFEVIYTEHTVI